MIHVWYKEPGMIGKEFTHCNLSASQVRRMLLKEG